MGGDTVGGDGVDWATARGPSDLLDDGGDSGAQVGHLLDGVAEIVVAKGNDARLGAVRVVNEGSTTRVSRGDVTSCSSNCRGDVSWGCDCASGWGDVSWGCDCASGWGKGNGGCGNSSGGGNSGTSGSGWCGGGGSG